MVSHTFCFCILQDRAAAGNIGAQASVVGKMPMSVGVTEDKPIRPTHPGTPAIMDPNALR